VPLAGSHRSLTVPAHTQTTGRLRLISTLTVLTHGHDPETASNPDGTTYLRCRECRILAEHDPSHPTSQQYPCPSAVYALQLLEAGR